MAVGCTTLGRTVLRFIRLLMLSFFSSLEPVLGDVAAWLRTAGATGEKG